MKQVNSWYVIAIILSIFATACDRNASSKSSITVQLPHNLAPSEKLGTLSVVPELRHIAIQITAPDLKEPIQKIVDSDGGGALPASIEIADIPGGHGRLIQVLAAYRVGSDENSAIYYGDVTQSLNKPEEAVNVDILNISNGVASEVRLAGRYFDSATTGPTGTLQMVYTPTGKPSMPVDKKPMAGGWFRATMFENLPMDYILPDGSYLGQQWTSASVPVSNLVVSMIRPAGYEQRYENNQSTFEQRAAEKSVLGFFSKNAAFLSDKKICVQNAVSAQGSSIHNYGFYSYPGNAGAMVFKTYPIGSTPTYFPWQITIVGGTAEAACGALTPADEHTKYLRIVTKSYGTNGGEALPSLAGVDEGSAYKYRPDSIYNSGSRSSQVLGYEPGAGAFTEFSLLPGFASVVENVELYQVPSGYGYNYNCGEAKSANNNWVNYKTISPEIVHGNLRIKHFHLMSSVNTVACMVVKGKPFGSVLSIGSNALQTPVTQLEIRNFATGFYNVAYVQECLPLQITPYNSSINIFTDLTATISSTSNGASSPILYSNSDCSDTPTSSKTLNFEPYAANATAYIKAPDINGIAVQLTANNKGLSYAYGGNLNIMVHDYNSSFNRLGMSSAENFSFMPQEVTSAPVNSCVAFNLSSIFTDGIGNNYFGTVDTYVNLDFYQLNETSPATAPAGLTIVESCANPTPISGLTFSGQHRRTFAVVTGGTPGMNIAIRAKHITSGSEGFMRLNVQSEAAQLRWLAASPLGIPTGACTALTLQTSNQDGTPKTVANEVFINLIKGMNVPATTNLYGDSGCSTTITKTSIAAGTSSKQVFFRGYSSGSGNLEARNFQTNMTNAYLGYQFTAPLLTGTYSTPCVPVGGATIAAVTHMKTTITFGTGGNPDAFEAVTFYTSNSSCTTNSYAGQQQGTVMWGNATSAPTGGYTISFQVVDSNILLYTAAATNDFTSGCSSWGPYSAAPSLRTLYSDISCANLNLKAGPTTIYNNIVVVDSNNITMGTPTGQNPGVGTPGAVSSSQTLILSK